MNPNVCRVIQPYRRFASGGWPSTGAFMLIVDAKNDGAVDFYQRHEFRLITGSPRVLFLPIATARKVFLEKHEQ